jgi:hypothetical protein
MKVEHKIRKELLDRVSKGEITLKQAQDQLKKLKNRRGVR